MNIQTYNINVYIPIEMNNKRIPVNVWHRKKSCIQIILYLISLKNQCNLTYMHIHIIYIKCMYVYLHTKIYTYVYIYKDMQCVIVRFKKIYSYIYIQ